MNVLRSCAVATALLLYDSQRTSRALAAAPHQLLASKHRLDASCTHLNGGRSAVNLTRFDTFLTQLLLLAPLAICMCRLATPSHMPSQKQAQSCAWCIGTNVQYHSLQTGSYRTALHSAATKPYQRMYMLHHATYSAHLQYHLHLLIAFLA